MRASRQAALVVVGLSEHWQTEGLGAARAKEPPRSAALEELTDREREVMALAAAGLSNEQIAERLVVSSATAKTHVSRAMIKLGARDRASSS